MKKYVMIMKIQRYITVSFLGVAMILESNRIQKDIPIPLYYQLKELILSEIKNGNYPGGSMIPTESEICSFFHISRTTVRQAITELVQEGHLYRVKSKGTFVAIKPINQDFIQKLESFDEQIRRSGSIPSTEILELSRRTADNKVAEKLNLTEGDPVIYLYRKRFADKRPIVLVETFLPYDKCSFLLTQDLKQTPLYQLLSSSTDTEIYFIKRLVEAVEANANDEKLMGIKRGRPIQYFESVGCNSVGAPIEFSIARYRGDYNQFEVTLFLKNK